mmetsp:Transcript_38940/g.154054  ORF Transcript_38940/g.154054 Transcript_38940/m.154054 type:complete len:159 (+) Transcript_38940:48-524(+)
MELRTEWKPVHWIKYSQTVKQNPSGEEINQNRRRGLQMNGNPFTRVSTQGLRNKTCRGRTKKAAGRRRPSRFQMSSRTETAGIYRKPSTPAFVPSRLQDSRSGNRWETEVIFIQSRRESLSSVSSPLTGRMDLRSSRKGSRESRQRGKSSLPVIRRPL